MAGIMRDKLFRHLQWIFGQVAWDIPSDRKKIPGCELSPLVPSNADTLAKSQYTLLDHCVDGVGHTW